MSKKPFLFILFIAFLLGGVYLWQKDSPMASSGLSFFTDLKNKITGSLSSGEFKNTENNFTKKPQSQEEMLERMKEDEEVARSLHGKN